MKQTLKMTILIVLMTIVTLSLASCNDILNDLPSNSETTPQDPVIIGDTTTPEPEGSTPELEETTPEAHVHTVVIDSAIAPTPTEDGWTEGKHCSTCGEILVPQEKIPAYGELAFTYKVNEDGKTCTLIGIGNYPGDVICIDRYIDGYEVVAIGDDAFSGCENVTSIQIPDSVTIIGDRAFDNCYALAIVEIPESVTTIGARAFNNCQSLTSITIPNSVTDIDAYTFYGCSSLTNVTLGSGVKRIGRAAFCGCTSLESIVIPKSVIEIDERTFVSCDALVSITVEEGNPVYHSSGNCIIETATKTLMIGFDNSVIPTDGSVTNIGKRAFWGCTTLTDITIPDSVTSIGAWAFSGCSSLKSITFGSGIASIGEAAFFRCDDLEDVYVTDLEAWLNIVFILPDNYELMQSESHGTHQPNGRANLHFLDENGNEMTSIVIPESVTKIREGAFAACRSLTSITIGNHVTSIGDGAFSGCSSLSNVEIPNSVTVIDHSAFYRCSSLSSIVIPDSVTSIGWRAFANCESVTSVTIGKGVTSIYSDAFRDCTGIKDVYVTDVEAWLNISFGGLYYAHPNWYGTLHILDDNGKEVTDLVIPEGVTSISDDLFHRCEALTSVVIPDSVTHIGESAFAYCSSLKSITFGNGVKSVDESAFYGCDDAIYTEYKSVKYVGDAQNPYVILIGAIDRKLSTYEIHPDTKVIAARAFAVCNNMTSITIPEGVVGIGEFAFRECVLLTSVVIPDSVVRIFGYTFSHCTALKNVTFENPNGWEGRIGEPNVNGNVYYYVEFAADELSNSKTAMQYLTSDYSQYRWDRTEPENPPCETHSYYLQNWVGVAQKAWGICTVCGYIDENHEHIIKDGKCQYCDFVLTTTEVSSVFDNDGDGQNEVYLFAPALPEKFAADGVIHVDAVEDNLSDNIPRREYSEYTSILYRVPYDHVYLEKGQDQYLLYTITVEEAGVYEMAIHLRLKDCMTRGVTYIINEGTENEYSFKTSYSWETYDDGWAVRNNDKLIGTYMFGIYVELQAGENTIKITETELARTQHFRDFYFVKVEE